MVRTRIAPSPTGLLHVGSLYIALKNYAYAKGRGGQFIIRIEDTDRERLVPGALEQTLATLKKYGLSWDEGPDVGGIYGPYIQSERLPLYVKYAQELIDRGKAYRCFCTKERLEKMRQEQIEKKQRPHYDRRCLSLSEKEVSEKITKGVPSVIRLKVPDHEIVQVNDLIRGEIEFQTDLIDDQVLLKSDGFPTYHLGVVVDDYLMKITHVIRGEEWISSTPKHVLLYKAFNWPIPVYAHAPDLLSPTGKGKMSKRQGEVAAQSFLDKGYLPEAMLNFLMILGWAASDQAEILSMDRYIKEFDVKDINKKSVAFDLQKLDYLNGVYIRKLTNETLAQKLEPYRPPGLTDQIFKAYIPLVKERLVRLADFTDLSKYLVVRPTVDLTKIMKEAKLKPDELKKYISKVILILNKTVWETSKLEDNLRKLQADTGLKPRPAFMSLRLALTGEAATPPLFDVIQLIGKEEVISRLKVILDMIE